MKSRSNGHLVSGHKCRCNCVPGEGANYHISLSSSPAMPLGSLWGRQACLQSQTQKWHVSVLLLDYRPVSSCLHIHMVTLKRKDKPTYSMVVCYRILTTEDIKANKWHPVVLILQISSANTYKYYHGSSILLLLFQLRQLMRKFSISVTFSATVYWLLYTLWGLLLIMNGDLRQLHIICQWKLLRDVVLKVIWRIYCAHSCSYITVPNYCPVL